MDQPIDFEAFRESWLQSIVDGSPSTVELGRRFALKLVSQWLDTSAMTADLVYCDRSGDGGIDVAFLDEGPDSASDAPEESVMHGTLCRANTALRSQGSARS